VTAASYVHRHVVTFDETNLVGNVYFAHYLHWQGHCRERFLADRAPGVVASLQDGTLALVTVSCSMDYHGECFALDAVEVHMTLRSVAGNRVEMEFRYVRSGVVVATGTQVVACMARSNGRAVPVEVPVELRSALAAYA
jgi:enediyne core biosynthesis thioesterase